MTIKNPLVSVCIPVYNHRKFLVQSIESVISQSYKNIEIVISDDHSTDGSQEIIKHYIKKYPKLFKKARLGNTNLGVKKHLPLIKSFCSGKYVCVFSGDDLMFPNKIQTQVEWLESNDKNIFHAHYVDYINSEGDFICQDKNISSTGKGNLRFIRSGIPAAACSFMYINNDLNFSRLMVYTQDFDLAIRVIGKSGNYKISKKILGSYRVHNESLSSDVNIRILLIDYLLLSYNFLRKIELISFINLIYLAITKFFSNKKPCYFLHRR